MIKKFFNSLNIKRLFYNLIELFKYNNDNEDNDNQDKIPPRMIW